MAGVKGKTGRHTNRSNQWLKGSTERMRTDEAFSFKPKLGVYELIKEDMTAQGMTKTEWLDMAVEFFLGVGTNDKSEAEELPEIELSHPLVREALADSLEKKRLAIARERKQKRPDKGLIEQWEKEIEELEGFL